VAGVPGDFSGVTDQAICPAGHLFANAPDFLLPTAQQLSRSLLCETDNVPGDALNLVFVHGGFPWWMVWRRMEAKFRQPSNRRETWLCLLCACAHKGQSLAWSLANWAQQFRPKRRP
jgi:pimeloyl-ACP methyl ester carboxylesterase